MAKDLNSGLTQTEADSLLASQGRNELTAKPRQTPLQILIQQFTSPLVILLILAAIASLVLGDMLDGVFIILIILLNGILGFVQEFKAEKAIAALKAMTVSTVRTVRDGIEQEIDSALLVKGDLIILEEGNKVPADCQLLDGLHVAVNEASLTGESQPVKKFADQPEASTLYLGTIIVQGRCRAIVIETGMQTKFGQIASSLASIKEDETPLQKKLDTLGKQLGLLAILASGTVFTIGLMQQEDLIEMILASISLAVAAVPEGLPAVITIALAVGMQRMAKQHAILRKLSSIEALGNTTIIATDKTGTLTKNEMRVVKAYVDGSTLSLKDNIVDTYKESFLRMLKSGVICNNASIALDPDRKRKMVLGDTTEGALILLADDQNISTEKIKESGKLIEEYAFDPKLKSMAVVWEDQSGKYVYAKGAPEVILAHSKSILVKGSIKKLSAKDTKEITETFHAFAAEGLRVLAIAEKPLSRIPKNRNSAEDDLIFLGLVGIADPPRDEVADAIQLAQKAGIRSIMITGDNEHTAQAIGLALGLIKDGDETMTGPAFEELSDKDALKAVESISIFARTTPDQKLRIVTLLQKQGHIVTVTGDGVNDSLALKQSDVGVAMGITGTDVAKEAADMIITDDNYATLVTAVEEGRTIFDNVKSSIKYLVGCNIGEVIAIVIGILLGWPLILTPFQLLYINLITDGLPTIALAVSPKHNQIMNQRPRTQGSIFDRVDVIWLLEVSLLTAVITLISFYIGNIVGGVGIGRAFAFTTIILVQQYILLDVRAKNASFVQKRILTDKIFVPVFLSTLVFQALIIFNPTVAGLFKIEAISTSHVYFILLISLFVLLFSEFRKLLFHHATLSRTSS